MSNLWTDCLSHLQTKVTATDYSTWLRPLQAVENNGELTLYAQNQFVGNWVREKFFDEILGLARFLSKNDELQVVIRIGIKPSETQRAAQTDAVPENEPATPTLKTGLNRQLNFENFVQGRSNQIAKSIAEQIAKTPGTSHLNPYSIYGGTGLGKTHLMHAIGNEILKNNPKARIRYLTGERFVNERGKAIHNNTIENFKKFYRSLDVLMVDDIQFLAKYAKTNSSSEEFLNTFNALIENGKQIVVVSDIYPQNIEGLEDRLKSRLTGGINAMIEPPELETRVAILIQKAKELGHDLAEDVAYFIGQKLRSDVRVLESAIKNLVPIANFLGTEITVDTARERLKDMFDSYDYLITIEKIQKTVADYYNIKLADLKSKSRTQTIARPRQIAMALAKELTTHSYPEIAREFGGRDHTTVMHACKKVNELRDSDKTIQEDYTHLTRKLSS
ncbi:chromosomal replication initiation protein DnaA [Haemophilus paracuniculus]|uniref:Chromosomal replication initiator protein DnaA n=1 Tax=Haemophilus paracuniculus TaxID=734 RepID=A0A1T0AVP7_9PAST|nr:chromosomal replication initiator protein DnaA [Haemophilus paracuniculus]OOS00915.1 chromosomal replication initiation protein DnaA [Haemophilus paracuniculus]